jgi:uncharacterized protein YndB with AHSA1/START domain
MIAIAAVAIAVLIIAVLVYAATRPDTFRIERSASINAPAAKVFALIGDFHSWSSWSPWEKMDPEMKRTHSGSASGKGAVYAWQGNNKVGEGRMEIIDATPPSKVVIKLDFLKPFEGHNTAQFTVAAEGGSTKVSWAMFGPLNLMMKVMHLFMDMDGMIGKDFEKGLANMKALAEK